MDTVLNAEERKVHAKKIRRQGWVPGNIYGPALTGTSISYLTERKSINF
jgi:ribosomal protein L25 (general stress protein Ctc)